MRIAVVFLVCILSCATGCLVACGQSTEDPAVWIPKRLAEASDLEDLQRLLEDERVDQPLTKEQAAEAIRSLVSKYQEILQSTRADAHAAKRIAMDENVMEYDFKAFGEAPESGHCLVISMHGGGGTAKRVNDQQWENQKRLYRLDEGIYLAPRAPTDAWNLWHQAHIDPLFTQLIANMIVFEGVDPNRVYLTGYSAGGDGVFQLGPRMADQFAAAAMMAGHPNETKADGLRNLPFTLHMGAKDAAYDRNAKAQTWKELLMALQAEDPTGYTHWVEIHEGKGHWMDRQDAKGVEWMLQYERDITPDRVVWLQDDVLHTRFYWLQVEEPAARQKIIVRRDLDRFTVEYSDPSKFSILLRDDMWDLSVPVEVVFQEDALEERKLLVRQNAQRTFRTILSTLLDRGDPEAIFTARLEIDIKSES